MQPTDRRVRSVFVFLRDTKAARRNERESGIRHEGLVDAEPRAMKDTIARVLTALAAIAAAAIAGGASLRGF